MHTGPQYTPTPQRPAGARGSALLIGALSFAVVFLLIVSVTVGYLVLRPSQGGGGDGGATASRTSATSTEPTADGSETATGSESATPTEVEAERCWSPPTTERTSQNPSGKLRGGGLQFIPPAVYDQRAAPSGVSFANDLQGAQARVEDSWYSTMFVGTIEWQPGVEYPGAEAASQAIVSCFYSANIWGDTSGRSLEDEVTEPVTIAGLPGYRTTAVITFAEDDLERTDATELVVVVLETDQGPSVFGTETAVGVTEHEEAADAAYDSLTGIV